MLSEEEQWEIQVLSSERVRAALARLQALARNHSGTSFYLDEYMKFLTMVHMLFPPPPPRPFVPYSRVLL
jgi:hypothetical protein